MKSIKRNILVYGFAMLALGSTRPLHAQLGVGTWVRQGRATMPGSMTMTVEACCHGGRRLIYHIDIQGTKSVLTVDSPFDGTDVPVLMNGQPSGETMAIKRLDDHQLFTIVRMNGRPFGTSKATLSADGRTLTVLNDYSSTAGGNAAGKFTEVWVRQ